MRNRIKAVRTTLGLSQTEFAKAISYSQGYYAEIEKGKKPLLPRGIRLCCEAFNVSETWLRTGEGEMFSTPESDIDVAMRVIADRVKRLDPDLQQEVYGLCRRILDQSAEPSSPKPKKTKKPASKTPKNK